MSDDSIVLRVRPTSWTQQIGSTGSRWLSCAVSIVDSAQLEIGGVGELTRLPFQMSFSPAEKDALPVGDLTVLSFGAPALRAKIVLPIDAYNDLWRRIAVGPEIKSIIAIEVLGAFRRDNYRVIWNPAETLRVLDTAISFIRETPVAK